MGVMIKKTGSLKKLSDVKANLKYIGFRSREVDQEKKGFFDKSQDGANMDNFLKDLENNKALKHPNAVKVHKFVYSLSADEYKHSNRDMKKLIRASIKRLENRKGFKINWIASFHNSDTHPHCHIQMMAVSENKIDGRHKRLYFNKDDFKSLRTDFQMEVNKEMNPEHIRLHENFWDKQSNHDLNNLKDVGNALDALRFELQKQATEIEREGEWERERKK